MLTPKGLQSLMASAGLGLKLEGRNSTQVSDLRASSAVSKGPALAGRWTQSHSWWLNPAGCEMQALTSVFTAKSNTDLEYHHLIILI